MKAAPLLLAVVILTACGAPRTAPATAPSRNMTAHRPPVIRARCEPCSVPVGKTATVRVEVEDPAREGLTYTWSAPAGVLATASAAQSSWTAPAIEGPVLIAIRVADTKGASASDVITITVTR